MRAFENATIDVPQHSKWHLFTGFIVLAFASIGGLFFLAWLIS